MTTPLRGIFVQTTLYKIKCDITKRKDDFLFNIPILLGQGKDWAVANISKFILNSVEVAIKPGYNFCTMASSEMGKVSIDFPIRLTFYSGNTVAETQSDAPSDYILDSQVEVGSATTGVKAKFGGKIFKTLMFSAPEESDTDLKPEDVMSKEEVKGWVDNFTQKNPRALLQKGRVTVGINIDDFKVKKSNVISDSVDNGNGASRRVIEAILEKKRLYQKEVKEEKKVAKKGRQQQPPEPQPEPESSEYCDTLVEGKLILDYPFYVVETYDVTYYREAKVEATGSTASN